MMTVLFIKSIIEHDTGRVYEKLGIMLVFWALVSIAVGIDLYYGVKAARQKNIARTSTGFRMTVKKANQYGTFLTFAFLFDVILSVWFYIPFATAITSAFLIFVEAKSVWENIELQDKKHYTESAQDFIEIINNIREEDKQKILDELTERVNEEKNNNNEAEEIQKS